MASSNEPRQTPPQRAVVSGRDFSDGISLLVTRATACPVPNLSSFNLVASGPALDLICDMLYWGHRGRCRDLWEMQGSPLELLVFVEQLPGLSLAWLF